jgi:PEP-CTERM motif
LTPFILIASIIWLWTIVNLEFKMNIGSVSAITGCAALALASSLVDASATVATIANTASPWAYSTPVADGSSTQPFIQAITPGAGQVLTFSSVTGTVNLTVSSGPTHSYGPDGGPSDPPGQIPVFTVTPAAGLSGFQAMQLASVFAGVFLNGNESTLHVVPPTLAYGTPGGLSTSSTSYSPLVDQVFFIGDGFTGTGTGTQQVFNIPVGATELVLGIPDAGFYNGPPGAYQDNSGQFVVTFSISSAVPEPSTWAMMILGFAGIGAMTYRRRKSAILAA